jgi:putative tryptophan/tyrosine transport system substrate-binding protein
MRRREFITVAGGAAAWPLVAQAQQQPSKTYSILWVSTVSQPDPFIAGFRDGMRGHGYVEGQNLAFILRYAPGDPAALRTMLPDLLRVPADLWVLGSLPNNAVRKVAATATESAPPERISPR